MITQDDLNYRVVHGCLPQLDFTNNKDCLSTISAPPVEHSKYASSTNPLKHASAGTIAKGIGQGFSAMFHMTAGDFGYGIGKLIQGTGTLATGLVDPTRTAVDSDATKTVFEKENEAWNRLWLLKNFIPASGNLGDTYYKDGSCDEFHCGNGYKIFSNGDYFEGLFDDGEISIGLYIYADGERYLGEFCDWAKHGRGITIYTDGTYYDGTYQNGEKDGVGTMWYVDGVYYGEWQNGMRHGVGIYKQSDGYCFEGNWQNDYPVE